MKKCNACEEEVDMSHSGPCPKCGNLGYAISVSITEHVEIHDSVSRTLKGPREVAIRPITNHTKLKTFVFLPIAMIIAGLTPIELFWFPLTITIAFIFTGIGVIWYNEKFKQKMLTDTDGKITLEG